VSSVRPTQTNESRKRSCWYSSSPFQTHLCGVHNDNDIYAPIQQVVTGDRKYTFVANSYTAPLENDFKIDANGARAFKGNFRCGVGTGKRFVNVHLHCSVSNLKMISKMSTLPPWKNVCGRPWLLPFSKLSRTGNKSGYGQWAMDNSLFHMTQPTNSTTRSHCTKQTNHNSEL